MDRERLVASLGQFFPGSFHEGAAFLKNPDTQLITDRLINMEEEPIHVTHFNQLLHLVHEAGVTDGFFRYYFLAAPEEHPYPVAKVTPTLPPLGDHGVSSLEQLDWGLRRFYIDALLFFGNIRSGYRQLSG